MPCTGRPTNCPRAERSRAESAAPGISRPATKRRAPVTVARSTLPPGASTLCTGPTSRPRRAASSRSMAQFWKPESSSNQKGPRSFTVTGTKTRLAASSTGRRASAGGPGGTGLLQPARSARRAPRLPVARALAAMRAPLHEVRRQRLLRRLPHRVLGEAEEAAALVLVEVDDELVLRVRAAV